MNDEIKKILENMKEWSVDGNLYFEINDEKAKLLYNYITNLQQEKDSFEKIANQNYKVAEDYKSRNEKAIEYIKTHTYDDSIDGDGTRLMFEKANGYNLLNILQGVNNENSNKQ